jgi:3-methyladenine DNA glycosylase AlkD
MDAWVRDLDSWDLCDQLCANLFDRTALAYAKAVEWSGRDGEFERRAGFALMATTAVHRKDADDATFEAFLPMIRAASTDDRNLVKKAVSWALRQIGKRNAALHALAIDTAHDIAAIDSRSARWIARDALRELESPAVAERLAARAAKGGTFGPVDPTPSGVASGTPTTRGAPERARGAARAPDPSRRPR